MNKNLQLIILFSYCIGAIFMFITSLITLIYKVVHLL